MSRRSPVVRGWSGGAMVLGKLSVPRRPTNLDKSRARAALAVCAGGGCLDIFNFVSETTEICLKGPLNPQKLTNQIQS